MSTRSQIKYKNSEDDIYIYKHSDGYPEGVLPVLVPFVEAFFKDRGDDECYFLAQCIRVFAVDDYKEAIKRHKQYPNSSVWKHPDEEASPLQFTGWGLDRCEHGDIQYLYEVDEKGSIYVNGKKLTKKQVEKYLNAAE